MMMIVIVMIIIIILTASYIGDDVRIVYSLANTMRSFSVTDGQGDSRSRMQNPHSLLSLAVKSLKSKSGSKKNVNKLCSTCWMEYMELHKSRFDRSRPTLFHLSLDERCFVLLRLPHTYVTPPSRQGRARSDGDVGPR